MEPKRRYYLASGKDEQIVREFFAERTAAFDAANVVAKKFGGAAATQGHRIAGIVFEGDAPDGWRKIGITADGKPYFLPITRSKAGKEAKKEIASVKIPGAIDLHSKFSGDGGCFGEAGPSGGFYLLYITAEIVNGQCIIQVPAQMDFEPAHSKPLLMSEYWSIKEASKAAA